MFKMEAILPRAKAYNQMLSLDAQWDYSLTRFSPGKNNGYTFEDYNNNLYNRTRNMQAGVLSWVEKMTEVVAADLGFTIPASVVDRVPPPPRKGYQGSPEDEEDDDGIERGDEETSKGVLTLLSLL